MSARGLRSTLALAAIAAAFGCGPGPIVRRSTVNTTALGVVERQLVAVRGLAFTADVPARVLDDAQVSALEIGRAHV